MRLVVDTNTSVVFLDEYRLGGSLEVHYFSRRLKVSWRLRVGFLQVLLLTQYLCKIRYTLTIFDFENSVLIFQMTSKHTEHALCDDRFWKFSVACV